MKVPTGVVRQIVVVAEDADQFVESIVVRRDVIVPDRPVVAKTVSTGRLEIVGPETQGDSSPVIGASAHHARPPPHEVRSFRDGERLSLELPAADARVELTEGP